MIILRDKNFSGEDYINRKIKEDFKKAAKDADILEEVTEKGKKIFKKKGFLGRNKKALAAAGIGTAGAATLATIAAKKAKKEN